MPYPEYSLLTPEDVDSIIQYLRTVPPNDNVVAADFPHFDQEPPAPPVKDADVPHTTLPADDPDDDYQMPPLVSHKVDEPGTQALGEWIDALP